MAKEPQYLYLTTVGWKSGNAHRIEIWFVQHEGNYYLMSESREKAHWVQNILRNPAVKFEVGDGPFEGQARRIDPAVDRSLAATVSALMDQKYGWSGGLIIALTPDTPPGRTSEEKG